MPDGRYLFVVPDARRSRGGAAVLYHAAAHLAGVGYTTAMLHDSPSARYANTAHDPARVFAPNVRQARMRRMSPPKRALALARHVADLARGGPNAPARVGADDILVVPEFLLDLVQDAWPDLRKVVFVQNAFSYVRACGTALARGVDPHRGVVHSIGISDMCMEALAVAGAPAPSCVPVAPDLARFPFRADKRRAIAYMPRKRPLEARVIAAALRRRGRIADFDLIEVDGLPQAEVAQILGDSLIFVSLMKDEALGFPAMEAMSAGCVTIGYTGVGTREYFDETTGIPVADGDTAALVAAVEAAVAEYDAGPERLDALRRAAAERIAGTYGTDRFATALETAWQAIAAS